jgi:hypothetical protein
MKDKIVHVCYGANDGDNVKQAVEGLGTYRFLVLADNLSCGPLANLDTPAGRRARFSYLFGDCSMVDNPLELAYIMGFQDRMGLVDLAQGPGPDESVLVWIGAMAQEQLLLRAVCALWPGADFFLADVRRVAHLYPVYKLFVPAFPPHVLRPLVAMAEPLAPQRREDLARQWHALTEQDDLIRGYEDDAIVGLPEDMFDADLLRACSAEFQVQARVAGKVQFEGKHAQGDMYLFERLQMMADRDLVEIQRVPGDIRSSLVRLRPGSAPPHIEANNISR